MDKGLQSRLCNLLCCHGYKQTAKQPATKGLTRQIVGMTADSMTPPSHHSGWSQRLPVSLGPLLLQSDGGCRRGCCGETSASSEFALTPLPEGIATPGHIYLGGRCRKMRRDGYWSPL